MPTPVFSSLSTNQKQQLLAQVVDNLTFTHVQTRGKDSGRQFVNCDIATTFTKLILPSGGDRPEMSRVLTERGPHGIIPTKDYWIKMSLHTRLYNPENRPCIINCEWLEDENQDIHFQDQPVNMDGSDFDEDMINAIMEQVIESRDMHTVIQGKALEVILSMVNVDGYRQNGDPYPASSILQRMMIDVHADAVAGPAQTFAEASIQFKVNIVDRKAVVAVYNTYASTLQILLCNPQTDFDSNQRQLTALLAESQQSLVNDGKLDKAANAQGYSDLIKEFSKIAQSDTFAGAHIGQINSAMLHYVRSLEQQAKRKAVVTSITESYYPREIMANNAEPIPATNFDKGRSRKKQRYGDGRFQKSFQRHDESFRAKPDTPPPTDHHPQRQVHGKMKFMDHQKTGKRSTTLSKQEKQKNSGEPTINNAQSAHSAGPRSSGKQR